MCAQAYGGGGPRGGNGGGGHRPMSVRQRSSPCRANIQRLNTFRAGEWKFEKSPLGGRGERTFISQFSSSSFSCGGTFPCYDYDSRRGPTGCNCGLGIGVGEEGLFLLWHKQIDCFSSSSVTPSSLFVAIIFLPDRRRWRKRRETPSYEVYCFVGANCTTKKEEKREFLGFD